MISLCHYCPMHDIAFFDPDLDLFEDIGSWQACGMYLFKDFKRIGRFIFFSPLQCTFVTVFKSESFGRGTSNGSTMEHTR